MPEVALEVTPEGEWQYPTVVVTVPRQSGKTTLWLPVALRQALAGKNQNIWYTAQTRLDARENLLAHYKHLEGSVFGPHLTLRRASGSEGVFLPNGSAYRIFSPVEAGLHGRTAHLVGVDEAWAFSAIEGRNLMQAILPTFSTTGGQLWIFSTAGTIESEWLYEMVKKGREACETTQGKIAYFEWGIGDKGESDWETIFRHHPAVDHTVQRNALLGAAELMDSTEVARAFGNQWQLIAMEPAIPAEIWGAAKASRSEYGQPPKTTQVVFGVDAAPDSTCASIVVSWRVGSVILCELVDHREGVQWLKGRIGDLDQRWTNAQFVSDGQGPAAHHMETLQKDGLPVKILNTKEYTRACPYFVDELGTEVRVIGSQPMEEAVLGASKRELGDRWVWGRRASTLAICPLVAATVAAWYMKSEEEPTFEVH